MAASGGAALRRSGMRISCLIGQIHFSGAPLKTASKSIPRALRPAMLNSSNTIRVRSPQNFLKRTYLVGPPLLYLSGSAGNVSRRSFKQAARRAAPCASVLYWSASPGQLLIGRMRSTQDRLGAVRGYHEASASSENPAGIFTNFLRVF